MCDFGGQPSSSVHERTGACAEAQTPLAKQPPRRGALCFGALRARWRPPAAGQAPARVICSGSGTSLEADAPTLVPAARPRPQMPRPAGMEPIAEEHESADE